MQITIGVDVGNFNTKSKHTDTVSGYTKYDTEMLLADKMLSFDGKYYVESQDKRFPFVEDKTENDQCLILTLFAMAKEILWRLKEEQHLKTITSSDTLKYDKVNLAIGLPPGHFNKLARKTLEYYKEKLSGTVTFFYSGFRFSFKLVTIEIYAQDLTAVIMNNSLTINNPDSGSPIYYIAGIGGYTVDIIPISNGSPEVNNCRSLPLGTRPMFETIIMRIQSSYGLTLSESVVENILRGKNTFIKANIKDAVIKEVNNIAAQHASEIIDRMIQSGCAVDIYPVVYYGGGCLLLEKYLEDNNKVCFCEFIKDTHANAANYEEFLKLKYHLDS